MIYNDKDGMHRVDKAQAKFREIKIALAEAPIDKAFEVLLKNWMK